MVTMNRDSDSTRNKIIARRRDPAEWDRIACRGCSSRELWSTYYDKDGLAQDDDSRGAKYRTVCLACGRFQDEK